MPALRNVVVRPMTPRLSAEEAARRAHEAALYWVDDSKGCECEKCKMKRESVTTAIDFAILAARVEQATADAATIRLSKYGVGLRLHKEPTVAAMEDLAAWGEEVSEQAALAVEQERDRLRRSLQEAQDAELREEKSR